jgi:hypothetical protein
MLEIVGEVIDIDTIGHGARRGEVDEISHIDLFGLTLPVGDYVVAAGFCPGEAACAQRARYLLAELNEASLHPNGK